MNYSKVVKEVLLDLPFVSSVSNDLKNASKKGQRYKCFFKFVLLVLDKRIPISLGVPDEWEIVLIDIFLDDYNALPFMPHVGEDGKLCLYDLEGRFIDNQFRGVLETCIKRAKDILEHGIIGDTHEEFVEEFNAYWQMLPNTVLAFAALPNYKESSIIRYNEKKTEKKDGKRVLYVYAEPTYFTWKRVEGKGERNGAYCVVLAREYIIPPDFRKQVPTSFYNHILSSMLPLTKRQVRKIQDTSLIIMKIIQPNHEETCLGVYVSPGKLIHVNGILSLPDDSLAFPVLVKREDKAFLSNRTGSIQNSEKKVLLIGAGSIGGYLCQELVHGGFEDITIVDPDTLSLENIYRHVLGSRFEGMYKAEALAHYFQDNYPELIIKPCCQSISDWLGDGNSLQDYDIVISAVGDHKVNRYIDREARQQQPSSPVVYAWNEPLDIGCHVAVLTGIRGGSYECLFDRANDGELFDKVAYTARGQAVSKTFSGCNGSFIPYGSTVSLQVSALTMECIGKLLDGRITSDFVISYKGEGFYFRQAGLHTSPFYEEQHEALMTVDLCDLQFEKRDDCD